jgi:DNA-directed RNA polymerase specialized sigma24 family protein
VSARPRRPYPGLSGAEPTPALPPGPPDAVARAILRVLDAMPPRRREVAALRLRHQLTTAEIAARLGLSPAAVARHLARATADLRAALPTAPRSGLPPEGRPEGRAV